MPKKPQPPSRPEEPLGVRAGKLAVRYAAGDKGLEREIFEIVGGLAKEYLGSQVWRSRGTGTGVPADRDEEDILSRLQQRVFNKLNSGTYVDDGRFDRMVMKFAKNVFIDALSWKKKAPEELAEEKAGRRGKDESAPEGGSKGKTSRPEVPLTDNMVISVPADHAVYLLEKEILNLILDGLRTVENSDVAEVWTARALLGKNEVEVGRIYGLKPDTVTSHYRRGSMEILAYIHRHPPYGDVPLEGLREVVRQRLHLEERDLALIGEEKQRKALRLAVSGELSLEELGEGLGMSPAAAHKTLRGAITALAKAKVRRVKAPVALEAGKRGDDWLWVQVGLVLDSFPKPPAQARAAGDTPPGYAELAALGEIAVLLGFSRDGAEPAKTLSDLIGPRIMKDGVDATAAALGVEREQLLRVLSGNLDSEKIEPRLLSGLAARFSLAPEEVIAALRASARAPAGLRTRAMTEGERQKYLDGLRRRLLGSGPKR